MAAAEYPDFDAALEELDLLERRERELSALRRRLHERMNRGFGNEETQTRERQVSDERRALHRRIDLLRAQVASMIVRRAAAGALPDLAEVEAELEALESQERELSAVRRQLHDQLDRGFPNEITQKRERQVSDERAALHARVNRFHQLRVQLTLLSTPDRALATPAGAVPHRAAESAY